MGTVNPNPSPEDVNTQDAQNTEKASAIKGVPPSGALLGAKPGGGGGSLDALKNTNPEAYEKFLEGIAQQMIEDIKRQQDESLKRQKEQRSGEGG